MSWMDSAGLLGPPPPPQDCMQHKQMIHWGFFDYDGALTYLPDSLPSLSTIAMSMRMSASLPSCSRRVTLADVFR